MMRTPSARRVSRTLNSACAAWGALCRSVALGRGTTLHAWGQLPIGRGGQTRRRWGGQCLKDALGKSAVLMALAAALLMAAATAQADDAVYRAFGGADGIQRVVNDFVADVHADPRTRPYFAKASDKRLRIMLAKQFCSVTGGPCVYDGSSMKAVHSNLKIDRAAFNAVVEVLQGAMDKHHVPFQAQNQLLAKLAPMYRDIETR